MNENTANEHKTNDIEGTGEHKIEKRDQNGESRKWKKILKLPISFSHDFI